MAQRASPISLHEHTHTHTNAHIYAEKERGREDERHIGERDSRRWMYVRVEGVGGCVSPVPPGALCAVRAMAGVDLAWHTKPWHLCPRHATLRGTARPARGGWQHTVCVSDFVYILEHVFEVYAYIYI